MAYKNEYFDRLLDNEESKTNKELVGNYFWVTRTISRVGYMFEAAMVLPENARKEAERLLINCFRFPFEDKFGTESFNKYMDFSIKRMRENGYPLPLFHARGEIVGHQRRDYGEDAWWRRLWFVNFSKEFPFQESRVVQLTGIKNTWTGRYYEGTNASQDFDGEWDGGEPGGLDPRYRQSLYICNTYYQQSDGSWYGDMRDRLVYPGDLQPVTDTSIIRKE